MGKSSINGPFSMAMLNNQMVCLLIIWGLSLSESTHLNTPNLCSNQQDEVARGGSHP